MEKELKEIIKEAIKEAIKEVAPIPIIETRATSKILIDEKDFNVQEKHD